MEPKIINYYEKPEKYNLNYFPEENREEEKENKRYYTKSRHSSDLTSFSYTPTEAFSQTSENSYYPNDTISHQNSNGENDTLNYFAEVITYFKQTEPAKFYEYKDSKNFIPKRKKEKVEKTDNQYNNISMPCNNSNNIEENKMVPVYYIPVDPSTYNNIINGNIIYYVYNNFFFNCPMNNYQTENDINKTEKNEKSKTPEKESKKNKEFKEEEKIEVKKKDDIEIIKIEKKREKNINKIEGNYIIKKRPKKNNNKSPIPKNEDKEIQNYESNKYRNKKDFHMYDDQFESKTYSNNYKGKYRQYDNFNKFNGNFGGRKKNYFGENKFYKRKYHQPMYY